MGSIGDCFDNAGIESFWGRMQTSSSTANAGRPASNSPTRSSNTLRFSTTGNAATAPSGCELRSSTRSSTHPTTGMRTSQPSSTEPGADQKLPAKRGNPTIFPRVLRALCCQDHSWRLAELPVAGGRPLPQDPCTRCDRPPDRHLAHPAGPQSVARPRPRRPHRLVLVFAIHALWPTSDRWRSRRQFEEGAKQQLRPLSREMDTFSLPRRKIACA
jgi:hypothetical protein